MTTDQAERSQALDREIHAMEAVLEALQAEHEALRARNADALNDASQRKLHCIDVAHKISADRAALMPNAASDANDEVSLRWEKLVQLAKTCKGKNELNGLLIRQQRRYVEQTLAVLRNDGQDAKLYGPDGEQHSKSNRRGHLGSA